MKSSLDGISVSSIQLLITNHYLLREEEVHVQSIATKQLVKQELKLSSHSNYYLVKKKVANSKLSNVLPRVAQVTLLALAHGDTNI